MDALLKTALNAMSTVKKFQKTFIALLLSTLTVFQGKATFRNLSRYSDTSEKRFSRWFRRSFDFVLLNWLMLSDSLSSSGNKTEGLGVFHNGCAGKAERGLEISLLFSDQPVIQHRLCFGCTTGDRREKQEKRDSRSRLLGSYGAIAA